MKKNVCLLFSGIIAASLVLGACGSSNKSDYASAPAEAIADYGYDMGASSYASKEMKMAEEECYDGDVYETYNEEVSADANGFEEDTEAIAATANRKLIKTVNLNVETREFDKLIETVNAKVASLGGYVENSNISGSSYKGSSSRDAYIVARIPSKSLDSFVTLIEDKSNVTNKSENAQDVTLEYSDVEARKTSLKIEQERLNALLEQADTLENIIELENRLTEVRYELESYESRLRTMDNQIDYSTVNLNVYEVVEYTPEPETELTFGQRFAREFKEGCSDAFEMIQDFLVGAASFLPRLLVLLVILGVIFLIVFFIIKGIVKLCKKIGLKSAKKAKNSPKTATAVATPVEKEENMDSTKETDTKVSGNESK